MLSSVTQKGDTVVMNFQAPAVNYFYYIADQVAIVPQHIWSSIADPVKYPTPSRWARRVHDERLHGQNITYKANPSYYVPGAPKLKQINYPAFTSNDTANTYLANGQAQWAASSSRASRSSTWTELGQPTTWFPRPHVSLFINLKNLILSDPAVRKAMAYASTATEGLQGRRVRLGARFQPVRRRSRRTFTSGSTRRRPQVRRTTTPQPG